MAILAQRLNPFDNPQAGLGRVPGADDIVDVRRLILIGLFLLDGKKARQTVGGGVAVVFWIEGEDFFGHGKCRFGGNPGRGRLVNPAGAVAVCTDSHFLWKELYNRAC